VISVKVHSLIASKRKDHSKLRGFTLVELLVVMTIIAIIVGLTPLAYERLHDSAQYRSTVRTALSDLRAARQQAMTQGIETRFAVDLQTRTFGVMGGTATVVPQPLTLRATMASEESGSDGMLTIRFLPRGGASGGSLDIIRPSGAGVRLRVDWFTGRVEQEAVTQ
jgi:general secretion pathway protein H